MLQFELRTRRKTLVATQHYTLVLRQNQTQDFSCNSTSLKQNQTQEFSCNSTLHFSSNIELDSRLQLQLLTRQFKILFMVDNVYTCQCTRSIQLHHLQYQEYHLFLAQRNFTFNLTFARYLDFCSWLTRFDQAHRGCMFPLTFALVCLCSQRLYVPPDFCTRLSMLTEVVRSPSLLHQTHIASRSS